MVKVLETLHRIFREPSMHKAWSNSTETFFFSRGKRCGSKQDHSRDRAIPGPWQMSKQRLLSSQGYLQELTTVGYRVPHPAEEELQKR